jgi:hypothetical protein
MWMPLAVLPNSAQLVGGWEGFQGLYEGAAVRHGGLRVETGAV